MLLTKWYPYPPAPRRALAPSVPPRRCSPTPPPSSPPRHDKRGHFPYDACTDCFFNSPSFLIPGVAVVSTSAAYSGRQQGEEPPFPPFRGVFQVTLSRPVCNIFSLTPHHMLLFTLFSSHRLRPWPPPTLLQGIMPERRCDSTDSFCYFDLPASPAFPTCYFQ